MRNCGLGPFKILIWEISSFNFTKYNKITTVSRPNQLAECSSPKFLSRFPALPASLSRPYRRSPSAASSGCRSSSDRRPRGPAPPILWLFRPKKCFEKSRSRRRRFEPRSRRGWPKFWKKKLIWKIVFHYRIRKWQFLTNTDNITIYEKTKFNLYSEFDIKNSNIQTPGFTTTGHLHCD